MKIMLGYCELSEATGNRISGNHNNVNIIELCAFILQSANKQNPHVIIQSLNSNLEKIH